MVSSVNDTSGYLLIAGDVDHYKWVVALFYHKLRRRWNGSIISVLGNHELWDDHPKGSLSGYVSRPISEIVSDYRNIINFKGWLKSGSLLQNAVYINYKNKRDCIIEEEQILSASEADLRDICSKASLIVLGGIGFSGLNERFNATSGLYCSAVTTLEEDEELSERFFSVYDKMLQCASEMQVIVLTHTPVSDWLSVDVNPNWIYINGHTHHNSLIRKPDGTTVLSDNQVGYKPTKWKLNSFTVAGWYDPFKDMDNGIHEITSDDYMDFNRGRGIHSNGCKYPGKIYVLKKNELYMFVLQSSSLCLLVGGQRKNCPDTIYSIIMTTWNDIHRKLQKQWRRFNRLYLLYQKKCVDLAVGAEFTDVSWTSIFSIISISTHLMEHLHHIMHGIYNISLYLMT